MTNERHKQFLQELGGLLVKYKVDIESKDYWQGYPECGEDVRMTAMFDGGYSDKDMTHFEDYSELDLGNYLMWMDYE